MTLQMFHTAFLVMIVFCNNHLCAACEDSTRTADGYFVKAFLSGTHSWEKAKDECEKEQGWLVRITDKTMEEAVKNLTDCQLGSVANIHYFYIGLNHNGSEWLWNDGTTLTDDQKNWGDNTDDAGTNQTCAVVRSSDLKWNSTFCDYKCSYICQSELLIINTTNDELISLKGDPQSVDVYVKSRDGPVDVCVYKLPNDTDRIETVENVKDEELRFRIATTDESHSATYLFSAVNDGYSRNTTVILKVHVPVKITLNESSEFSSPVTTGPNYTICFATGIPPPNETKWLRDDGTEVTEDEDNSVYQDSTNSSSILHFRNAKLFDNGTYICEAKNYVLQPKIEKNCCKNISLFVYGQPKILSTEVENCTEFGKINVTWMSNQTKGITHKIYATSNNITICLNDTADNITTTVIGNLSSFENYAVGVIVCPDECIKTLSDTTTVKTGVGLPTSVQNATVSLDSSGQACNVSWEWVDRYQIELVSFQINVSSSLSRLSQNTEQDVDADSYTVAFNESSENAFQISFPAEPNRNYSFSITSETCAGQSEDVKTIGECVTDVAAPSSVEPPVNLPYSSAMCHAINITIPDETNGPVGCFFVIMRSGKTSPSTANFTETNLYNASKASEKENVPKDVEYVAIAIDRINIHEAYIVVYLGDGTTSNCDIHAAEKEETRRENENSTYSGKNWPLTTGENYTYYVVTTTQSDEGPLFQQSQETFFLHEYDPDNKDNLLWIIVGVVLLVIILAIAVVVAIYYRRQQARKDQTTIRKYRPSRVTHSFEYSPQFDNQSSPDISILEISRMKSSTRIPLQRLKDVFYECNANEGANFSQQFLEIERSSETIFSCDMASRETVRSKNRYRNIIPYDRSRVKLSGNDVQTYINASHVHGFVERNKFIATQGPLASTVDDFWRMVVETKCQVIVMLTKQKELGRKKCAKYWPKVGNMARYNNAEILNKQETKFEGYRKRTLQITVAGCSPYKVNQFQFIRWPDHGVPTTTSVLIRFHRACMDSRRDAESPIIVHCSAGVGRTGTFIGFDYLLEEFQRTPESSIDIYDCVMKMRQQRMEMVQTCDQYVLLHRLLLEMYLFGNTDADRLTFMEKIKEDARSTAGKSRIALEFEKLIEAASIRLVGKPELDSKVVITWQPHDGGDLVKYSAYCVKAYENEDRMIVAETPDLPNMEKFWRVILDSEIRIIVMLNSLESAESQYWPSKMEEFLEVDHISVELKRSRRIHGIMKRHLSVKRSVQEQDVTQYQLLNWTVKDVLELVAKLRKSNQQKKNSSILVHCSDGLGLAGVFCSVINLIARFEAERKLDVFRTVKDLQDCAPRLVQTTEEYRFCYKALSIWMDSQDVRENVFLGPSSISPFQQDITI